MFNPFKKKENNDFQMNDMELPSLGENNPFPNNNSNSDMSMPELPDLSGNPMSGQPNPMDNPNMQSPNESYENTPGLSGMQEMNATPSFETAPNNNINNNNNETNSGNPFANEQNNVQTSSGTNQNQELHNEISKAKLDTISSKMEILEHRVSNIDNKLDLILKLIQAEVSPETKMKVNMNEKMQQFR